MAEWHVAHRENWQLHRISRNAWLVLAFYAALATTALVLVIQL